MFSWITPEMNTVLVSAFLTIIGAATPFIVAWFRLQTKKLNDIAQANKELLEKNTEIAEDIKRQTDGINKKMIAIAEVVSFTKGRIKGRKEGESNQPYEELDRLEEQYGLISKINFEEPDPDRVEEKKVEEK